MKDSAKFAMSPFFFASSLRFSGVLCGYHNALDLALKVGKVELKSENKTLRSIRFKNKVI